MKRQANPVLISDADGDSTVLQRYEFRDKALYDEDWLQKLIDENPNILPIWEIEPVFWPAKAVCRELPLPAGSLDNLFVTDNGDLVLVECKLWRNPQARREVIAQVIDYAKDLKGFSYAELEKAIQDARSGEKRSLFEIVDPPELPEEDFVDAVSRNLSRGRALLIVAGDGVTESAEAMTDYLQQHVGIHFTLALVQLAVYSLANGDRLIVPSVPLRTTNVTRGIVVTRDGKTEVQQPPDTARTRQAASLTAEEFFSEIDANKAGTSDRILELIERGRDIGLYFDIKRYLMVRMPTGDDTLTVLTITPDGGADVSYVWAKKEELGTEVIANYLKAVASHLPAGQLKRTDKGGYVRFPDRFLTIWDILAIEDSWFDELDSLRQTALEKLK